MTSREHIFYRIFTRIFFVLLFFHILLALFLIFIPNKTYITESKFEKAYRLFALTGPFFSEDRINVVPHVYCSIKEKGGDWGENIELGKQHFSNYHNNYFNYNELLQSSLPRYLCRQIQIQQAGVAQEYLESLTSYLAFTNPTLNIDSAMVVYTLESVVTSKTDTLFVKSINFGGLK